MDSLTVGEAQYLLARHRANAEQCAARDIASRRYSLVKPTQPPNLLGQRVPAFAAKTPGSVQGHVLAAAVAEEGIRLQPQTLSHRQKRLAADKRRLGPHL